MLAPSRAARPSRILPGIASAKRIGTGLAVIGFPLIFVLAFAVQPNLLSPQPLTPVQDIQRAHGNDLMALAQVLILFDAGVWIVLAVHFMRRLEEGRVAWMGLGGAVLTVAGAIFLAAEKGAEGLTIGALSGLSQAQFDQAMPALVAIFSHDGWMILVVGLVLGAIGATVQTLGLMIARRVRVWQGVVLVTGVWLVGLPEGEEIYSLIGSCLLAFVLVPYGISLVLGRALSQNAAARPTDVSAAQPPTVGLG
jgi:hypothetical protein